MDLQKNTPVVLGEANTVSKLGPVGIREKCSQEDSDTIGHFLQVVGYLSNCSWRKGPLKYPITAHSVKVQMPELEAFVYAAVYFRQLGQDKLLDDAVQRYLHFVDSTAKRAWVEEEKRRFDESWESKPSLAFFVNEFTTRELFDAFIYGAFLIHSPAKSWQANVSNLTKLFETHSQLKILATLHGGLHQVANHANGIGVVIQQDFAHWTNSGLVPRPDVRWHRQLFSPQI